MKDFDLAAYLDRIGLARVPATPEGLRDLQRAQLRAIAFENMDAYLGITPSMGMAAIFEKIVTRRRGGYCFELNALLGAAMAAAGFPVRRALARVRKGHAQVGPRSHLTLLTEIGGRRFLADAGFGGPGPLVPLEIVPDREQAAPNGVYRLRHARGTGETLVEKRSAADWVALYGFDEFFVGDMDIGAANFLCANWPVMPFPNHLMLAGFQGDTRIGVFDRAVTVETGTGETRQRLRDFGDFADLVTRRLGLSADDDLLARVWARLEAAAPGP